MACATYIFDPGTFVESEQSRQMRYCPEADSDFSVLVKLHRDGGIDIFKYRGSELICEASGSDFRSAMTPHGRLRLSPRRTVNRRRWVRELGH
jgi:hypothetical protein